MRSLAYAEARQVRAVVNLLETDLLMMMMNIFK